MDSREKVHIAIVGSPGIGHLTPVLLLGKRLTTHHNVHVTILAVTTHFSSAESQVLREFSGSNNLSIVQVPVADVSGLINANTKVVAQLYIMMRETRPLIRSAILSMNRRPNALVVDIFGPELFPIADELCVPKYVFVTTTAWFVALTTYCPVLDKEIKGQYVDQKQPLEIPGCTPIRPEDVVDPMLDRSDEQYVEYVRSGGEYKLFDGILMNTWEELESKSIQALRNDEKLKNAVKVPVYPIGPLVKAVQPAAYPKSEVAEWLDAQASESVIYVSFGSGGTLSREQVTEVAWGLELSQQRFIWVVRPPIDTHADGAFFNSGSGPDGTPDYLPQGFFTRTCNLGKVVPLWAPQVAILSHPSVGGILSHCGWNSTLESLMNGVPMIAWPLYGEQKLNATMLSEELGVAIRPRVLPTKEVVGRGEIENMVRCVMQCKGKEMREKVKQVKLSGEYALTKFGSSYNSMREFVMHCERSLKNGR